IIEVMGRGYALAPVGSPTAEKLNNRQLAECVSLYSTKGFSPFKRVEDLSAFSAEGDLVPASRLHTDKFADRDIPVLAEMSRRFGNGDIDKHTLVVAVTSNAPALACAMSKQFKSDIYLHLPAERIEPGDRMRLQEQGQTYFGEIKSQREAARASAEQSPA